MNWLDVFRSAESIGADTEAEEILKKREAATSALEKMKVTEEYMSYLGLSKTPGALIVHPIPSRYLQLLKIPEMPDPNKDYFI